MAPQRRNVGALSDALGLGDGLQLGRCGENVSLHEACSSTLCEHDVSRGHVLCCERKRQALAHQPPIAFTQRLRYEHVETNINQGQKWRIAKDGRTECSVRTFRWRLQLPSRRLVAAASGCAAARAST